MNVMCQEGLAILIWLRESMRLTRQKGLLLLHYSKRKDRRLTKNDKPGGTAITTS